MVLNDFYTVTDTAEDEEGKYVSSIKLNKDHDIFKGHFPGNPITPGVCMMQIIKELTQSILGYKVFMNAASNVKFMATINPEETPEVRIEKQIEVAEDGVIKLKSASYIGETVALKLNVSYLKV